MEIAMQREHVTQPSFETLELTVKDHVAEVFLNRPQKANSMNPPMWRELQACFEWLDAEPSVRVVILAAHGKHFCAGIDLEMFASQGSGSKEMEPTRKAEVFRRDLLKLQENLSSLENCSKPVLAAIHNTCIGGGVDMVTSADLRYASEDAFFSIREIDIGMTADVGTLQRLPKIVPYAVAAEMAYTGRNVTAAEAQQMGLVNRVFADRDALLEGVREVAAQIASKSPVAVRGTKAMLLYTRDHSVAESLNYMSIWNASMLSEEDLREGLTAQMEKRAANFQD